MGEPTRRRWRLRLDRDLLLISLPTLLVVVGALAFTLLLMRPAPPREIVMTTGSLDGGYHTNAMRLRDVLEREGVTLRLWGSNGSVENLRRFADPAGGVDVGYLQGGIASHGDTANLQSLGAMYLEPVWIFYRAPRELDTLTALRGKSIAVGELGSGTAALARSLLRDNGLAGPPTTIIDAGGPAAADLLLQGAVDAAFFVADTQSPVVHALIRDPRVRLMSLAQAEAYVRQHHYLARVTLPRGVFDLEDDVPARDYELVAPAANLVVRQDLHPALAYLLLRAATQVHGRPTLLGKLHEFPRPDDSELALSPEAVRYYKSGVPFLQRYLPFWAANLADRLLVLLVPALALLLPAMRLLPALYRWRVRSRIYRWYARLKEIELDLEERLSRDDLASALSRLDRIEDAVNHIDTPLAYSENLYVFRQHIDLVRQRIQSRLAAANSP
jgi:TRAP transporter TAXI family solute receptor